MSDEKLLEELTPEEIIQKMNDLWTKLNNAKSAKDEKITRNEFVKCQQQLSQRAIPYYQDGRTRKWKLG